MSDYKENYTKLVELMEDEFNGQLNFCDMSEDKFITFVQRWLLGSSEYQTPINERTQLINKLFWQYMFGDEFMSDKIDEVKLK
ncbi:MAG TPA: hypothetical protein DCM40_09445 [Maribacter sp.]|nr:hypothetical protein [Maribacter sp.]